jgi:hypothetical protein
MYTVRTVLAVMIAVAPAANAVAQESTPPTQSCPIDTTTDKSTGKPRSGFQVCGDNGSGSVGFSASGQEIKHFFEYPIGTSDKSVAKQIGNTVHNFFHHL